MIVDDQACSCIANDWGYDFGEPTDIIDCAVFRAKLDQIRPAIAKLFGDNSRVAPVEVCGVDERIKEALVERRGHNSRCFILR